MTHSAHTPASRKESLPVPPDETLDDRSRRAREERMAVTAFGTNVYEVASESGYTYLVDVGAGRCTCPDHVIRGERCKHLRRVAIEITEGRVPPPGHVARSCRVCGDETFVRNDADPPFYCDRHRLSVGDRVRDRETGVSVVVVSVSDRRADEVTVTATGELVADYAGNEGYPRDDPVVGVVYPESVRMTPEGARPPELRVYSFPYSRLEVE